MSPDTLLEAALRLTPPQKSALKKLGLHSIRDLFFHFPTHYSTPVKPKTIRELVPGEEVVVYGTLRKLKLGKGFRKHIAMADGILEDATGRIKIVWFNQPYLAKMIGEGASVRVVGKISVRKPTATRESELYFANPEVENLTGLPTGTDSSLFDDAEHAPLYPTYPESRGITSRWFYYTIQKLFKTINLDAIVDSIPPRIREKYHLPILKTALIWVHAPKKESDATTARKRFP